MARVWVWIALPLDLTATAKGVLLSSEARHPLLGRRPQQDAGVTPCAPNDLPRLIHCVSPI